MDMKIVKQAFLNWIGDMRDHHHSQYWDRRGEMEQYGLLPPLPWWQVWWVWTSSWWSIWTMRVRYTVGAWLCKRYGHGKIEIDESGSGPERPVVHWFCHRCGVGGRSWL